MNKSNHQMDSEISHCEM